AGLYFSTTIVLIWGAVTVIASPVDAPLSLEKGMHWAYEGKVEWTVMNSTTVLSTNIHWVTDVVEVMERGAVRASIVRGLPNELEGKNLARRLTNEPYELPSSVEEWLAFPLEKGKRWGEDTDRHDNNYCWYVQGKQVKNLRVKGYPASHPAVVWSLIYRTNPD